MEETKFSLRLLVDEKRNKVVLAEACRDFVDVLFSLLTLPMGTIVRLLEKHNQQPMRLGCFNNNYKSVSDMTIDDFETEACKTMLLYPRSTKEIHCRRLKLNVDDTEATKFFTCPRFPRSCSKYSNFNTSRCSCGGLMTREFQVSEEDQLGSPIGNNEDGVFVSCRSSYIVTDDMRVTLSSLGVISKELNLLGYADFDDVKEILLDVGTQEVLTLLGNFFASDFPLSRTFLGKDFLKRPSTHALDVGCVKGGHDCNVKIFVRKSDKKIIYAECSEDFIDSLLGFLVLPLELAWSLTNDGSVLGWVGNLCRSECREASSASTPLALQPLHDVSYSSLSISYTLLLETYILSGTTASSPLSNLSLSSISLPISLCMHLAKYLSSTFPKLEQTFLLLPYYYTCSKQILDIPPQPEVIYSYPITLGLAPPVSSFVRNAKKIKPWKIISVTPRDPKIKSETPSKCGIGFVKRDMRFIVSDNLAITPMSSSSTIGLFMKSKINNTSDLEEQEISISKAELINILRASLISRSALTVGLSSKLAKNLKRQVVSISQIFVYLFASL
ncbi:BnaA05g29220D [Brassica napus]|uniref:(rape) hypothetical protein n=1 Tax=Brassica napus TaxID=3708 RepID=A0A078I5C4_BRANA|nr:unnamed protein product [Brassica napus]CDY44684.1 BnaA05g29220D [Brassica napus]